MSKKTIIKQFSIKSSEGIIFHLSEKTSLKTGNKKFKDLFVSWDKIGGLLFDNYNDNYNVAAAVKLRGGEGNLKALNTPKTETREEVINDFFEYLDSLSKDEYDSKSLTGHSEEWLNPKIT